MKAIVFTGADIKNYEFCYKYLTKDTFIVCCDKGMVHAKNLNITPDYIVGDFDSVPIDILEYYKNKKVPIYEFTCEKDETDTQLGVEVCIEKGAKEIIIIGGIGSRFDHTLANAHYLMKILKKGIKGFLVDEKNEIQLVNKSTTIFGKVGEIVSTIPLSFVVKELTLEGFKYPLYKKDLYLDDDIIAVSNILIKDEAYISFSEGYIYIIKSKD